MKYCYVLALSLLLSACSLFAPLPEQKPTPAVAPVPVAAETGQSAGWWNVHFRIAWPDKTDIAWYVDVYLASKIVEPVLRQYQAQLTLWRFHRRAARDAAGHQFSFVFYSSPAVAQEIYRALQQEPDLQLVQDKGLVTKVIYQDTSVNRDPLIQDGSDKAWSLPVQRTWPYFIMGASDMWLRLIDQLVTNNISEANISDYDDELAFYRSINTKLDDIWRNEGGHAFLHHLNAVFGYQETLVVEQHLLRF